MQLVSFNNNDIVFNWHELPEPLAFDFKLRDKFFNDLQKQFKDIQVFDTKTLFEMNKFVINKIKIEAKDVIQNIPSTKNS